MPSIDGVALAVAEGVVPVAEGVAEDVVEDDPWLGDDELPPQAASIGPAASAVTTAHFKIAL